MAVDLDTDLEQFLQQLKLAEKKENFIQYGIVTFDAFYEALKSGSVPLPVEDIERCKNVMEHITGLKAELNKMEQEEKNETELNEAELPLSPELLQKIQERMRQIQTPKNQHRTSPPQEVARGLVPLWKSTAMAVNKSPEIDAEVLFSLVPAKGQVLARPLVRGLGITFQGLLFIADIGRAAYLYYRGQVTATGFAKLAGRSLVTNTTSYFGAALGASGGATLGTLVCPGLGTIIGGFVGAMVGGFVSHYSSAYVYDLIIGKVEITEPTFAKEALYLKNLEHISATHRNSIEEVERIVRKRALHLHPDKGKPEDKEANTIYFVELKAAEAVVLEVRKALQLERQQTPPRTNAKIMGKGGKFYLIKKDGKKRIHCITENKQLHILGYDRKQDCQCDPALCKHPQEWTGGYIYGENESNNVVG